MQYILSCVHWFLLQWLEKTYTTYQPRVFIISMLSDSTAISSGCPAFSVAHLSISCSHICGQCKTLIWLSLMGLYPWIHLDCCFFPVSISATLWLAHMITILNCWDCLTHVVLQLVHPIPEAGVNYLRVPPGSAAARNPDQTIMNDQEYNSKHRGWNQEVVRPYYYLSYHFKPFLRMLSLL